MNNKCYYLVNIPENKTYPLGSAEDLNKVAQAIIHLVLNNSDVNLRRFGGVAKEAVISVFEEDGGYNQTGKDIRVAKEFSGRTYEYSFKGLCYNLQEVIETRRLRPWMVVDEKGRHIEKDVVLGWLKGYNNTPVVSDGLYDTAEPTLQHYRISAPALRRRTAMQQSDVALRQEVEELAGTHAANRLFASDKMDYMGFECDKMYHRRPIKSWKRKKCVHQWQRYKKCGQAPKDLFAPAPAVDISALLNAESEHCA